ncbi:alpha/beta fold hydrolase [Cellulomonas fengjieae]|uniref:Alpha/beta fold hydrolase n=1 Tax=Cellulomonas fengjieae TaxID=2819978 RepID=A0ABS3SF78_9CELL|nr:alpha/beta fold hydrolase [Cellulomonas fengjieae]MBO3084302.1 alpha/beta fold hydrolase [Cellulomonas fengjieae]QVI67348.1 alpha/beta fold hydrolase [Cellulomonas fengjieae]
MTAASHPPPDVLAAGGIDPRWSQTVEVGPHTWHVLDNGATLGTEPVGTLLCVHGNPTWSFLWRRLVAAGARPDRPWRVVAVDQLEMGYSERTGEQHRLADRVAQLGALTDHLGLAGPVVTVGHDWGGVVSLGWALDHPELLAGVVLTNTAVHHDADDPLPAPLRLATAPGVLPVGTVSTPAFLEATLALAHPRLDHAVADAFRAPYRTADRRSGIGGFVADIPGTADHPSRPELDRIADGLGGLDVPALLLWGPRDPVFSARYLRDLRDRLPHADVHRFEGAGHLVVEDADVAGAVLSWLDAREGPSQPSASLPARPAGEPYRALGATLVERADDEGTALIELRGPHSRRVSWSALAARTEQLARGLAASGVRPGDRVGLLVPPGADLTALLYACLRLGAVVVVADAGLGVQGLTRAVRAAEPAVVVGIERALVAARWLHWAPTLVSAGPLRAGVARALGVEASLDDLAALGRASSDDLPWPDPDADAAVLFTSGSTGPAKGVVYTHRRLAAMRDVVARTYGIGPDSPLVAAFAPFVLLGPALGAASASPDMDVTSPGTLTAQALADAVQAVDAAVVFASPAALRSVVRISDGSQRSALAGVRLFLSAGAPVGLALLEAAADVMPAAEAHTPYGMTEALVVTDVSLEERRAAGPGDGVCVGRPVPGVDVAVSALDGEGRATGVPDRSPGVTGEVLVGAAHVKERYDGLWLTQQASARDEGWHRTGDVGHLDGEGRLWIEGRLAHVLVTPDGVRTPVGLEQRAQDVDGVVSAAVVGVGPRGTQQVVVVVQPEVFSHGPLVADPALAGAVRAALDGTEVAAVLVVEQLPTDVRHSSKVDRTRVAAWAERVLAGQRARL